MKGWYIPTRPDQGPGESTAWYASYWSFCADYLRDRFGDDWCLSPEQSLSLHVGDQTVPQQLVVRSSKGSNNITALLQNTSILDLQSSLPVKGDTDQKDQLNLFSMPVSLVACSPNYFRNHSTEARTALAMIADASEILARLLEGGRTGQIQGRLAGEFETLEETE